MILITSLITLIYAAYDGTDYLKGEGSFNIEQNWIMNQTEEYMETQFVTQGNDKFLKLYKKAESELSFKDGFYHLFEESQPQHIRFWFASGNKEIEDTNLRLKDTGTDKTAISFRCGYAGFVRVNDNQMITFYNSSVSTDSKIIWTQADILLNWDTQEVLVFMNESYMGSTSFYHQEVTKVNEVMLYNLKPNTTSWWKNIKICKERCDNFEFTQIVVICFTLFILLL
ncbi:unnamed protein product [Paramecium pentaurelia]|uniref:Uncharacterized protein n=1 Tax=Paramecium pentaurelia TaxID=43138 RepID=A0A8S1TJ05_9CILI|nr:unnamed protein product [Paramecium pentaurelia]